MQTNTIFNLQHIDDYMVQNGYQKINSPLLENAAAYVKENNAVLFYADVVEYKRCTPGDKAHAATILFKWASLAMYKGFDGSEFKLMMLLDFMGAIKLKDVNKKLRGQIVTDNLLKSLPLMYDGNPVVMRNAQNVPA